MEFNQLFSFVLSFVLVAVVIVVGIVLLDKLGQTSGLTTAAQLGANQSRDALVQIPRDWLPILVLVGIMSVVIVLLVRAFSFGQASR